jgi:hypothetical protein
MDGASTTSPYFFSTSWASFRGKFCLEFRLNNLGLALNIISKLPTIINFSLDLDIDTFRSWRDPIAPICLSGLFLTIVKITISACVPKVIFYEKNLYGSLTISKVIPVTIHVICMMFGLQDFWV